MLEVKVSYWHEGKEAYDWLDITPYLKEQFTNGLPSGLKEGIYPDDIATKDETGRWYDLVQCIARAIEEQQHQVDNTAGAINPDGSNPSESAKSTLSSLQHFFDGRVHAIQVHDTETSGVDKYNRGIMIRLIMEYRYTSRNA